MTRSHRMRHFRQSFRDIFRPEVADGVISGVIVDRSGTHVPVIFCESKPSHFQATAFCPNAMTGVCRRRRRSSLNRSSPTFSLDMPSIRPASFVYSSYRPTLLLVPAASVFVDLVFWNSLSDSLRSSEIFPQFCSHLKTHLFCEISP